MDPDGLLPEEMGPYQRRLSILSQLVLLRSFWDIFPRLERPRLSTVHGIHGGGHRPWKEWNLQAKERGHECDSLSNLISSMKRRRICRRSDLAICISLM